MLYDFFASARLDRFPAIGNASLTPAWRAPTAALVDGARTLPAYAPLNLNFYDFWKFLTVLGNLEWI